MITACKNSVSEAYSLIGEARESEAGRIAERLEDCNVRESCPYAQKCLRTIAVLRRDVSASQSSLAVVSSGSLMGLGDSAV